MRNEITIVSVVVPCYNQAQYLAETLDSVIAQTYPDWECIIVNDGSPDNTEEIAKEYCAKDSRFKYLKQDNQGIAVSRNNGIRASSGTYILPLDSDDKIAPTYIQKAICILEEDPTIKLVYCETQKFGMENYKWRLEEYQWEKFIWNNSIICSAIYRKSDFERTDGYDPNMKYGLEDWDFWLSFLTPDDKVYQIQEPLFFYRTKQCSRNIEVSDHIEDMLSEICKNHPDIYDKYAKDILLFHRKMDISYLESYESKLKLERIINSWSYKIGQIITGPWRFVKSLLK